MYIALPCIVNSFPHAISAPLWQAIRHLFVHLVFLHCVSRCAVLRVVLDEWPSMRFWFNQPARPEIDEICVRSIFSVFPID